MDVTTGDEQQAARRKRWKRNWVKLGSLFIILAVIAGGVFIGPATLNSYDDAHSIAIRCAVTSGDAQANSSSYRGIGGSTPQVVIRTSDCGSLIIRQGVTRANRESIASELKPGTYSIDVGAGSWKMRGLLGAINIDPTAYSFRRV